MVRPQLYMFLLLVWTVLTNSAYYSKLQGGAIWPMVGRNQYHTGHSVFGIDSASVQSATSGKIAWSLSLCSSSIYSPPIISRDGTIYVGCGSTMYAVDSTSRVLRWTYATEGAIMGAAALSSRNFLYFGNMAGVLYALQSVNGTKIWSRQLTDQIRGGPVLGADGGVHVGTVDGYVHKVAEFGSLRYSLKPDKYSSKIQGNLAYFGSSTQDYVILLTVSSSSLYPGEYPVQIKADNGDNSDYFYNIGNFGSSAIGSPSIDPNTNLAYYATNYIQGFYEVGFKDSYTTFTNLQSSFFYTPVKCCGTSSVSISSCNQGDKDHLCAVMGSSFSAISINADNKYSYWASGLTDGKNKDDTTGKDFFYVYDNFATRSGGTGKNLVASYGISAPVRTSPVIDRNGIIYIATSPSTGSGSIIALKHDAGVVSQKGSLSLPGCSIYSSPALNADGSLIFGGSDGKLYAVSNADISGNSISASYCAANSGKGISSVLQAYQQPASVSFGSLCSTYSGNCDAGTYSTGTVCAPCAPGSYVAAQMSSACSLCEIGKYSSSFASTSCTLCSAGQFSSRTGLSVCFDCAAGKVSNTVGSTECIACSEGKSSVNGSSVCTDCSAGRYSPAPATPACLQCNFGFISGPGATACTPCPIGTSSNADFTTCVLCPEGKYSGSSGSTCDNCPLGYIHALDRRSCVTCSWPTFTSIEGSPACNTFTLVPYRNSNDLFAASITLIIIIATLVFFYIWTLLAVEVTDLEETHYSGNIVTRLGISILIFLPNGCLVLTTLYVLTKNFANPVILAFMWLSMLTPFIGFNRLLQENHALPWAFKSLRDESSSGNSKANIFSKCANSCEVAFKTIFSFVPVVLFGFGCYLSRALVVRRVWNFWFLCYTGEKYQFTRDKFQCRFWNHVHHYALICQFVPQLILVALSEGSFAVKEDRLAGSWTLIGTLSFIFLVLNALVSLQHLLKHRGKPDALVELHIPAIDVVWLHFDPVVIDFQDDAPLEQGMVRGAVIFDGEGMEEAEWVEVLHEWDIVPAKISNVSVFARVCV